MRAVRRARADSDRATAVATLAFLQPLRLPHERPNHDGRFRAIWLSADGLFRRLISRGIIMGSKLAQLREMTVVVADTGDIDAIRKWKPVDCTTNPTLLLKAFSLPGLSGVVDEVLQWGRTQKVARDVQL